MAVDELFISTALSSESGRSFLVTVATGAGIFGTSPKSLATSIRTVQRAEMVFPNFARTIGLRAL